MANIIRIAKEQWEKEFNKKVQEIHDSEMRDEYESKLPNIIATAIKRLIEKNMSDEMLINFFKGFENNIAVFAIEYRANCNSFGYRTPLDENLHNLGMCLINTHLAYLNSLHMPNLNDEMDKIYHKIEKSINESIHDKLSLRDEDRVHLSINIFNENVEFNLNLYIKSYNSGE